MALRTVEPKKRTLHTQNKQIRRSIVSERIPPEETSGVTSGQMPKASGRFFIPEDNQGDQPSKDGEIKSGKRLASGKVLHAALGKRIQEVRKARKLSQNELADMVAGCNRKRISSIENGSPTITVGELFCIAMELEESANYLITGCRADYPALLTDHEEESVEWQRQYLIQDIVRLIEQLPHEKLVEIRNEAGDMLRSKN